MFSPAPAEVPAQSVASWHPEDCGSHDISHDIQSCNNYITQKDVGQMDVTYFVGTWPLFSNWKICKGHVAGWAKGKHTIDTELYMSIHAQLEIVSTVAIYNPGDALQWSSYTSSFNHHLPYHWQPLYCTHTLHYGCIVARGQTINIHTSPSWYILYPVIQPKGHTLTLLVSSTTTWSLATTACLYRSTCSPSVSTSLLLALHGGVRGHQVTCVCTLESQLS